MVVVSWAEQEVAVPGNCYNVTRILLEGKQDQFLNSFVDTAVRFSPAVRLMPRRSKCRFHGL